MSTKAPAMSPSDTPYTEVLDRVTGPRRAEADDLVAMMREVTGEEPVVWAGRIIGFGTGRYRYETGHGGTVPLAAFATNNRQHTVYLSGGFREKYPRLLADLGPHRATTGCLHITRLAKVNVGVLRTLVERTVRVARAVDAATDR
ncbi:DUF1801 domain-containing protein [Corynebacterium variabile]|uniref:DUF1801 domain-containing protein n=1 Tax=Corynebacterium variabile TaxID=1727 RepID=UPI001D88FF13|nr:DUF1801 domain-containing protein [Corynebacterium variabile]HJG45591.1 DUF1801 domain-containing protein [Corynebacterium variabile]